MTNIDISLLTPEQIAAIAAQDRLQKAENERVRKLDEDRIYKAQLASVADPMDRRRMEFAHDHATAYARATAVVGLGDEKDYEQLCEKVSKEFPFVTLSAHWVLIVGIVWNLLFFWLYRWTLGRTKDEFEEKRVHGGFGTAFGLIIILNFLFFLLLFLSSKTYYHAMIYNAAGERQPWYKFSFGGIIYLLFYGWIGGLRNRCTGRLNFLFALLGGLLISFSGLIFYLMSLQ